MTYRALPRRKRGLDRKLKRPRKTARFSWRVTPEELRRLQAMAEGAGVTAAAYARACVLGAPPRPRPIVPEANHDLHEALGRVGNNLNQVARRLHKRAGDEPGSDGVISIIADVLDFLLVLRRELVGQDLRESAS